MYNIGDIFYGITFQTSMRLTMEHPPTFGEIPHMFETSHSVIEPVFVKLKVVSVRNIYMTQDENRTGFSLVILSPVDTGCGYVSPGALYEICIPFSNEARRSLDIDVNNFARLLRDDRGYVGEMGYTRHPRVFMRANWYFGQLRQTATAAPLLFGVNNAEVVINRHIDRIIKEFEIRYKDITVEEYTRKIPYGISGNIEVQGYRFIKEMH